MFRDHFSRQSESYAAFRPRYPAALFEFLAAKAPGTGLAWDCATGNGQAAEGLVVFFRRVVATDASAAQLAAAQPHPRIEYRAARADASSLPAESVDLVTVAQALHWFDLEPFYTEVARVLAPGGMLAVWCYDRLQISPEIDVHLEQLYSERLGAYWPPERAHVERRYGDLPFPFEEIVTPRFEIVSPVTLAGLGGYLGSWSATQRYRAAHGGLDPVAATMAEIARNWGDSEQPRQARWPLHLRAGYQGRS